MPRVIPVGARENTTAKEVADLYELFMEDGRIDDREHPILLAAHDANCDAADVTERAIRLARCVMEAGVETRTAKVHLREWMVAQGGPEFPEAA